MDKTYYEVFISAENQAQADHILNSLLKKKLATGGQFIKAPARFLWKENVENMDYITITSFTTSAHEEALINDVESNSDEEVPMICFVVIKSSDVLSKWIDQTLK